MTVSVSVEILGKEYYYYRAAMIPSVPTIYWGGIMQWDTMPALIRLLWDTVSNKAQILAV